MRCCCWVLGEGEGVASGGEQEVDEGWRRQGRSGERKASGLAATSSGRDSRMEMKAPEEPRELEHPGGVALGREGEQYGAAAGGRREKFGIPQCSKVGFGVLPSRKLV